MAFLLSLKRFLVECGSLARLGSECLGDYCKLLLHCKASPFVAREQKRRFDAVILTHTIEKGLSLPCPRPLFGAQKIAEIVSIVDKLNSSSDLFPLAMAIGALDAYVDYHQQLGIDDPIVVKVRDFAERAKSNCRVDPTGGTRKLENTFERIALGELDYSEFLQSRSSIRCFADKVVPEQLVRDIVRTAQSAPSQCNRQSSRVHCFQSSTVIQELLSLQGGAAGFSDSICNLFIVTNEMSAWSGARERNQAFVDGALFAMCLLYSCHSAGIAACPLNLAVTNGRESAIHRVGAIPNSERAIMMIAFGYPSTGGTVVAKSPRLDVDAVLSFH